VPCPPVASAWDRYRGLCLLLAAVLAAVGCVGLLLVLLVRLRGGLLSHRASLLADLAVWSVLAAAG